MFHWICPECGQEIAPGVKECPVCEPQAIVSSAPSSSAAPPISAAPSISASVAGATAPELTPESTPEVVPPAPVISANAVVLEEQEVALQPEVVMRPDVMMRPQEFERPKLRVVLDAIPAEAGQVVMPDVPLGTSPVEIPDPLESWSAPAETFSDRLANLAESLHGERIPYTAPRIFQESAAPGPREQAVERTPVIVDVSSVDMSNDELAQDGAAPRDAAPTMTLLASPPSMLLLAEPQPPAIANEIPMEEFFHLSLADCAARAPQAIDHEPVSAGAVSLPDAGNREVAPALAPLEDYSEAAGRLIRPAECDSKGAAGRVVPAVTLPGPALPRELLSLQAAGLVPIRKSLRQRGEQAVSRHGGVMKYIVVGILLTAGVATYSIMPGTSPSAPPRPSPEPQPEPPVSARSANSLARFVEVTGIRFMEVNKKPQIHYLVVNHSNAPLNSVMVYVTLHSAQAKPGQPPIARLTFRSPALAAFEAKEMFSSIERASAPLDLPDWQDLHAEVEVQ